MGWSTMGPPVVWTGREGGGRYRRGRGRNSRAGLGAWTRAAGEPPRGPVHQPTRGSLANNEGTMKVIPEPFPEGCPRLAPCSTPSGSRGGDGANDGTPSTLHRGGGRLGPTAHETRETGAPATPFASATASEPSASDTVSRRATSFSGTRRAAPWRPEGCVMTASFFKQNLICIQKKLSSYIFDKKASNLEYF